MRKPVLQGLRPVKAQNQPAQLQRIAKVLKIWMQVIFVCVDILRPS